MVRLSPDSARTKNTMANVAASQKTARTAFNFFILVTPFVRASVPYFIDLEPRLALCGSTPAILRRTFQKRQAQSSARESY
jgi:hypothetical protein